MSRRRTRLCCHRDRARTRYDCKAAATHIVEWHEILEDGQPCYEKRLCERHAMLLAAFLRRVGSAPDMVSVRALDAGPGL